MYGNAVDDAHRRCAYQRRRSAEWAERLKRRAPAPLELFGPDGKLHDPFALGLEWFGISDEERAAGSVDKHEKDVYFTGSHSHDWNIPPWTRAAVCYRARFRDGARGPFQM